jgi:hypothetical protein
VRGGSSPAEAAALAKTLCDLLDMWAGLQAANTRRVVDGNVATLVGLLVLSEVAWQA